MLQIKRFNNVWIRFRSTIYFYVVSMYNDIQSLSVMVRVGGIESVCHGLWRGMSPNFYL
jgi:hypothetical protein